MIKLLRLLQNIFQSNKRPLDNSTQIEAINEQVEEKTLEELYPGMSDDAIMLAILEKNEDDLTLEELAFSLGRTLYHEQLDGRFLAIKELITNNYQILSDESGNPYKEVINFTLNYFETYFTEKPEDAEILLGEFFPITHQYIYRQILKQQIHIETGEYFDEQKAFDEFLVFIEHFFNSNYSEKSDRELQIKHHFKIISNSIIEYIEDDKPEEH